MIMSRFDPTDRANSRCKGIFKQMYCINNVKSNIRLHIGLELLLVNFDRVYLNSRGFKPQWCSKAFVKTLCNVNRRRYIFSSKIGANIPIDPSSVPYNEPYI